MTHSDWSNLVTHTAWTRVSRIFSEFQLCTGWGGKTARKFQKGCTVLRGNREMTEKYEYYCPVARTFVQDCSNRRLASVNSSCTHPLPQANPWHWHFFFRWEIPWYWDTSAAKCPAVETKEEDKCPTSRIVPTQHCISFRYTLVVLL